MDVNQMTHADITAAGYLNPDLYVPRARHGRKLTITERRELFIKAQAEAEEAKVRRERHAAETGTSARLWK